MNDQDPRSLVLVADDDGVTRAIVSSWLVRAGYEVLAASDGEEALQLAREREPDLLLVDVTMPGRDGYEVCREIQERSATPPPVIFLTAHSQTDARVAGLDAGAVDYIVKPFANEELVARVRAALRTKAVRDGLAERAARDGLTGLFNRRELDARADEAAALAMRHGRALSCLLLDIDHFKSINDTHGHAAGDTVLREVAERIRGSVRISDIVGRYGGEEFVVLLPETASDQGVTAANKLREVLAASPIDVETASIPVRASIGVATWDDTMRTAADLYAAADGALYRAKELGRDRTELHDPLAARG
ncbi:MAG TPA: diguanylate cyclase [Solirubrobacteraceae bacterium]|nr:diguanylate cyclase [Solirubrobacteraceae bacterium]